MQVHFWGTRGSLPASVRTENIRKKIFLALSKAVADGLSDKDDIDAFIENRLSFDIKSGYGCNTACIEVRGGAEFVLCDAGSGLRDFGNYIMAEGYKPPQTFHIFLSHLHWDHINGFPFFAPAFIPGNSIHVHGFHHGIEKAFIGQQQEPYFPIPLDAMSGDIHFHEMDPDRTYTIAGYEINGIKQPHPGNSFWYAFKKEKKKFVYSTDSEHLQESENENYPFIEFARDADLLVFDAQYRLADHIFNKKSWGHSSNIVGVELATRAGVKHLCMFHTEHTLDDHQLDAFLAESREYARIYAEGNNGFRIDLAYDGLAVDLI